VDTGALGVLPATDGAPTVIEGLHGVPASSALEIGKKAGASPPDRTAFGFPNVEGEMKEGNTGTRTTGTIYVEVQSVVR
jgi:hypothetical protein